MLIIMYILIIFKFGFIIFKYLEFDHIFSNLKNTFYTINIISFPY